MGRSQEIERRLREAPGQVAQVLGAIAAQAKILEVDDFAKRLAELERRVGNAK